MGRISKYLTTVNLSGAMLLLCGILAAQSVPSTMPQPNRNITAPGPQRPVPPQQQRAGQFPGAKAPQSTMKAPGDGVIVGYVWWDANSINHLPANNCSGLSISVSAGSPSQSSPSVEQFTPLGTYTNSFTYIPNVGSDGVCEFTVQKMPVGQDLQVRVDVTTPTAFSPISAPMIPMTPIKIIDGKCNNLPPAVPSSSVLSSNWWACGKYAYNVNFPLRASAHVMSGTGGPGLMSPSSGTQRGMLSNSAPQGMLAGGAAPSGSGVAQVAPSQGRGLQSPGSKLELNPQPFPPGQKLSNVDVARMVKGGVPESVIISSVRSSRGNFDLSPSGCSSLRQAHVSEGVLNAMGDGSVRPCAQGATSGEREKALAKSLKLKLGPKIRLTSAPGDSTDPGILKTLQAQSIAAHKEKTSPPATFQSSGGGSSNPRALATNTKTSVVRMSAPSQMGPAHTMGSGTDPATAGSGTDPGNDGSDPAGTPPGGSQPGSTPSGGTPLQQAGNSPQQVGGTPDQNSLSLMQRAVKAPQPLSRCRFTTDPVIETVSGRQHGIVLTPDPGSGQYPNNQYTIRGCNFGSNQGQLQIYGAFINNPSPVQLGIDSWNDNQILVTFNPTFQNEYDLNNVTLALVRTDGHNTQMAGISFYATRGSRQLVRVPQSLVKLPTAYLEKNSFVSPVNNANLQPLWLDVPAQPASAVFFIYDPIWSSNAGDGYPASRLSFSDSIDFSKLHPGFTLDQNVQTLIGPNKPDLSSGSLEGGSCKYWDVSVGANLQGSNLLVGVQPEECDNNGKFIFAYYGLQLSVTGPKGDLLDPWPSGLQ